MQEALGNCDVLTKNLTGCIEGTMSSSSVGVEGDWLSRKLPCLFSLQSLYMAASEINPEKRLNEKRGGNQKCTSYFTSLKTKPSPWLC